MCTDSERMCAGLTDGAVVHLVERLIAPPEPGMSHNSAET